MQADTAKLDADCLAELGSIAECEEELKFSVKECAELEQQALNDKEESRRKQVRPRFRLKSSAVRSVLVNVMWVSVPLVSMIEEAE